MSFKIQLQNPDFASEYTSNKSEDVMALRDSMAEWTPGSDTTGRIVLRFTPGAVAGRTTMNKYEQLANFIALINKGWNHLAFMAGLGTSNQSPPLNPWGLMRQGASDLDATVMSSGCVHIVAVDDHYEIRIDIFRGATPRTTVVNVAMRIANIAQWCIKYDGKIRLTGASKLKWKTFNEITVQISPGIKFPERREPAMRESTSRRQQQRNRLRDFYDSSSPNDEGDDLEPEDLDDEQ